MSALQGNRVCGPTRRDRRLGHVGPQSAACSRSVAGAGARLLVLASVPAIAGGERVIRTPVQAPNANAHAERWVRTVRADCLDRILILGRRHLEHVLRVYRLHYNEHRPHRALRLVPPDGRDPTPLEASARLRRHDLLGGLIHEYEAA